MFFKFVEEKEKDKSFIAFLFFKLSFDTDEHAPTDKASTQGRVNNCVRF